MKITSMTVFALAFTTAATPLHAQSTVTQTLATLDATVKQKAPVGLTPADAKQYAVETTWLASAEKRINQLGTKTGIFIPPPRAKPTPPSVSTAFDNLRTTLLKEGAKFDAMTGASKTRHDVAMNAIRNMKA